MLTSSGRMMERTYNWECKIGRNVLNLKQLVAPLENKHTKEGERSIT